ncbi:MAG: molybdopterin guanine dinucleotide synthesis [Rhodovulum sp.]
MRPFDTIAMADWSARAAPSPVAPSADAIWIATWRDGSEAVVYHRTRAAGEAALMALLQEELEARRRVLLGLDFAFGYPAGFAHALTGEAAAAAVRAWLATRITDDARNRNNRFEVAAAINAGFPGVGPFWGRPAGLELADLPALGRLRHGHGMTERRAVERVVPRAQTVWKLYTTGAVGSQVLVGLPMLHRLSCRFGPVLSVWPFDPGDGDIVLAEIYPSLIDPVVRGEAEIRDAAQVRLMARGVARLQAEGRLADLFAAPDDPQIAEEGWILGVGQETALYAALTG